MNQLPNEIIIHIISFCCDDYISLCNCWVVSKKFYHLSFDQSMWKQLSLSYLKLYSTTSTSTSSTPPSSTPLSSSSLLIDWKHFYNQINVLSFKGDYHHYKLIGHRDTVTSTCLGYRHHHHYQVYDEHSNLSPLIPSLLISGSDDTSVKIWSLANRLCLYTYQLHNHPITCVKLLDLPSFDTMIDTDGNSINNYGINKIYASLTTSLAITACKEPSLHIWYTTPICMGSCIYRVDSTALDAPITVIDANQYSIVASDGNNIYIWKIVVSLDERLSFILTHKSSTFNNSFSTNPSSPLPHVLPSILSFSIISTTPFSLDCNNNNNNMDKDRNKNVKRIKQQQLQQKHREYHKSYKESTMDDLELIIRLQLRFKSSITQCDNIILQDIKVNTINNNNHQQSNQRQQRLKEQQHEYGREMIKLNSKWYTLDEKGDSLFVEYIESEDTLLVASNNNTVTLFKSKPLLLQYSQQPQQYGSLTTVDKLYSHTGKVIYIKSDSQKIVTMSSDSTIKVWSKKFPHILWNSIEGVNNGEGIVSGCFEGPILVSSSLNNPIINLLDFTQTNI